MMKLGFVSAILDNRSLEEVIDTAASIGYECVEVACWPVEKASRRYAGVTHINIEELDEEKIRHIHDYCEQKGVAISALAYYPNVLTEDRAEQDRIRRHLIAMIEAAPKLQVDTITTFIGRAQHKTVEENLEMGAYTQPGSSIAPGIADVYKRFPRLEERRRQVAGTLSGGEQQMLAMGRALMSRPKLLMLDEPSMGLAPILVEQIFDIIKRLHQAGTTILLVEQNARMALSVADRGYVLETGKIVSSGTGSELLNDESVKKAYLGG